MTSMRATMRGRSTTTTLRSSFPGFVDDAGHFALDDRARFRDAMQRFKGQEVLVTVPRKPRRQGTQLMRYYRGVVIPDLAEACGYADQDDDFESVHQAMAWKFLRLPDGQFGEPRRRSTGKDDLTSEELSDYVTKVITFAETSIPGCRIRRPEELDMDTVVDPEWA